MDDCGSSPSETAIHGVRFVANDSDGVRVLYERFHDDPLWDPALRDQSAFDEQLTAWSLHSWFGDGGFEVLKSADDVELGFITLQTHSIIEANLETTRFVELGTYLIPEARGRGFNVMCKLRALEAASKTYCARAVVSAIPEHNHQAIRAFRKLQSALNGTVEEYEGNSPRHRFHAFWKRRSFIAGDKIRLFIIRLDP